MIYTHEERKAWDAYDDAMRRVRNVLTHFGVADCDDPLAALEEVPERADAVVDDEVAHANELTLQVAALRAIIEGRTTPPTFAEVDALAKDGGAFRYRTAEGGVGMVHTRHDLPFALGATEGVVTTWWAHDADRRPCAWPSVSQEPAQSPPATDGAAVAPVRPKRARKGTKKGAAAPVSAELSLSATEAAEAPAGPTQTPQSAEDAA